MTEATISVLDHGHVRLVDHLGDGLVFGDAAICRAARVMPDAEWRGEPDEKLIRYMLRNRHTSPFEHVVFTFDVKAPIFVFRQWHRHRAWSFNEISGRYQELPDEFYVPDPDTIGEQSASNRQGRQPSLAARDAEVQYYNRACVAAFDDYQIFLKAGWPRELARCVLPLATYSRMMATVDLHNLLHFLDLRLDEHAQFEIRVYAEVILKLIKPIVPVTVAAWRELRNGR